MTDHEVDPEPEPSPGPAGRFRGALVIAAAVVLGGLLLAWAIDDDENEAAIAEQEQVSSPVTVAAEGGPTTTVPATTAPPTDSTTTTTVPVVRPPAQVRVLVLNGSGQSGVAARGATFFTDAGYATAEPANAARPGASVVYYAEGYRAEAEAIANALEVDPARLLRPLDPDAPPVPDLDDANVIVVAGNDDAITF